MSENSAFDLLASPVQKRKRVALLNGLGTNNKNKLCEGSFSLDNICKLMAESERKIVDLSAINQRVIKQLEADQAGYEHDDIKKLLKVDTDFPLNFDDSIGESSGEKLCIFTCEPNTVFRADLLYRKDRIKVGRLTELIEKQADDESKAKIALRILSLDKDEQRLGTGKAYLAQQNIRVQLHSMFPTMVKILINYGIDPALLDKHVFHFANIKQDCRMRTRRSKNTTFDQLNALDLYSCFPQVLDCLHLLLDDKLLEDLTLVHDYMAIIMLLFIDHAWNTNRTCMRTLKQFLLNFFKRLPRMPESLSTCTDAILKFLPSHSKKVVTFLAYLPSDTKFGKRLKSAICTESLEKLSIQFDSCLSGLCLILEQLHASPLNDKDRLLVILFIKEWLEDVNLEKDEQIKLGKAFHALAEALTVNQKNHDSVAIYRLVYSVAQSYTPEEERKPVKAEPEAKKSQRTRPRKVPNN